MKHNYFLHKELEYVKQLGENLLLNKISPT